MPASRRARVMRPRLDVVPAPDAPLGVVSAFTGAAHAVPAGMVGCIAVPGGRRLPLSMPQPPESFVLVPLAEHRTRGDAPFVIDPARHAAWDMTVERLWPTEAA